MYNRWLFLIPLTLTLCVTFPRAEGANIFAFLPTFSPSHLIIEMAVIKAMAERNHNVTVVSVLPLKSEWLDSSMTYIQLDTGIYSMSGAISATQGGRLQRFRSGLQVMDTMVRSLGETLGDPKLLELMHNGGNHFDLMLYGYMYADFFFGLGEHFDCPVALLWPNIPVAPIMQIIGNPLEMSYAPLSLMNTVTAGTGFLFRLKNMLAVGVEMFLLRSQYNAVKEIYGKHFPTEKYASFEKAKERVAMVLFSHHFSEKPVRPLVPAMIEIGGIHLNEEPKPLPADIAAFANTAEHGVIFFSLGTNIKAIHLQDHALDKIYNVLSKLPQRVIWKCDDESNVPGNSTNILYRKWLPQGDILGHPNVKLFFGHGGKGGITEAKFYGVPMVGLPLFADQPMNMEEVVTKGYGLTINHDETLTEEVIYRTVKEVLENETYARSVKAFSALYRDRPLKVKDNAVYWLEYLIRYKGAAHLQSPLKTMSFIEKTNLDVFALILIVFYLILQIMKYSTIFAVKLIRRQFKSKSKRD